jgi:hypothetical protein
VLEVPEELTLVVWYWQVQLLMLVFELPPTVPVSVTDCETITTATEGLITMLVTFALPPPHPARARNTRAPKPTMNPA